MKKIIAIFSVVLLTGCAVTAPKFNGPGGMQEFANARYQCVQETSARVSGAAVNQFGGFSNSTVMPTCSAFVACLASKGYFAAPNGRLDPNAAGIVVRCR